MNRIKAPKSKFHHPRFVDRMRYAKYAMTEEYLKDFYRALEKPGLTLFECALLDSLYEPVIIKVGWKKYTGQQYDEIPITVYDDSMVILVEVAIVDKNGFLIEDSYALPVYDMVKWVYTVEIENPAIDGCSIIVSAEDNPGNRVTQIFKLPG